MERQTGERLIEEPEIPLAGIYLWNWFWWLNAGRGGAGLGPAPISYLEIEAWARLTGVEPLPFEVEAIKAMDRAYLETVEEKGSK